MIRLVIITRDTNVETRLILYSGEKGVHFMYIVMRLYLTRFLGKNTTRWDYLVPLSATVFVTFSLAAVFGREASHMGDWV